MRRLASLGVAIFALMACRCTAFTNCTGVPNPFPVNRDDPVFVRQVANGKRYLAGQGNDTFHVLHLYGSHYDMGYAHGQLLGEYFDDIWTMFEQYVDAQVASVVPFLPQSFIDLVVLFGLPAALQLTVSWTQPYPPKKYLDEMIGIADGAGYPVERVFQLNMFPEIIKAACTIVGATGSATLNGKIAHLRDLDIDATMPIKDWPLVTVLHGDGSEPVVANFGWAILAGSLTGISSNPVGVGEKVWENEDKADGVQGEPWMFILRDVLYTKSIDEAIATMQNANRTCAIHVGVGDGVSNQFRGVTMAKYAFDVYNWSSIDYPEHPILEDIMYWDKHSQPTTHWCLSTMLKEMYGNLTAEMLATQVSSIGETGNFHSVTFDYEGLTAYVANARKTNVTVGGLNAYERQYTFLNISRLMAETL
jgi:isopenicillin-N N-acyltransferase-like protein